MNIQDMTLTCFASMPQKAVERQFSMGVSRFRTPCRGTDVIHPLYSHKCLQSKRPWMTQTASASRVKCTRAYSVRDTCVCLLHSRDQVYVLLVMKPPGPLPVTQPIVTQTSGWTLCGTWEQGERRQSGSCYLLAMSAQVLCFWLKTHVFCQRKELYQANLLACKGQKSQTLQFWQKQPRPWKHISASLYEVFLKLFLEKFKNFFKLSIHVHLPPSKEIYCPKESVNII